MRFRSFSSPVRYVSCTVLFASTTLAQAKPRIAVFPFDDRTTSTKDMSIGAKVADLLISKLTANGAYTVYDRQYIDRLLSEKALKYDPNYDSATAAKSGLMGTVDLVVSGQIDAFNANASQNTSGKYLAKRTETDGAVVLKVTARLISVAEGSILTAPSASTEQKGVLAKSDSVAPMLTKHLPGAKDSLDVNQQQATSNTDLALRKLVDEAADEVAKQLAAQVAQSAASIPVVPAKTEVSATKSIPSSDQHSSALKPAFAGVSEGLAYIDKGSQAGIKLGQKFVIQRNTDTGLKNGAGEPILKHKPVCTLTISSVEESSASGKCVATPAVHGPDGTPRAGDEVAAR